MSDLDSVSASGTVLPNEVLSHVKMAHFAVRETSRPVNGTLIVIPESGRTLGVLEPQIVGNMTEVKSVLGTLVDGMGLGLA